MIMLWLVILWFGSGLLGSWLAHQERYLRQERFWQSFYIVLVLVGPLNLVAASIFRLIVAFMERRIAPAKKEGNAPQED